MTIPGTVINSLKPYVEAIIIFSYNACSVPTASEK